MSEVYITKAIFKQIIKEGEVGNDYHFKDTLVWNHDCGYFITEKQSWIFISGTQEIHDLLKYKVICVDINKGIKTFYKKIEARDSWMFIQNEQTPCYHCNKDCESLKSSYLAIEIPYQIRENAEIAKKNGHEAGQIFVDRYRQYWKKLEKEFLKKYGEDWRTSKKHTDYFTNNINMHFKFDPPIRDIAVSERDNSGIIDNIDNRSAQEISDSILEKIKDLRKWATENPTRSLYFNKYAEMSQLEDFQNIIKNMWASDTNENEKIWGEIEIMKEEIIREMKELYMRLFIPNLKFDAPLLDSIGFRPCHKCYNIPWGVDDVEL